MAWRLGQGTAQPMIDKIAKSSGSAVTLVKQAKQSVADPAYSRDRWTSFWPRRANSPRPPWP